MLRYFIKRVAILIPLLIAVAFLVFWLMSMTGDPARTKAGDFATEEQIEAMLSGTDRSLLRKWIPDNYRATGLFVYDIAIDLRTLFCVSTNQFEPEISKEMIASLEEKGWIKSKNVFGECQKPNDYPLLEAVTK